ncbi:SH3 domain-containing protein [Mariprofundus sp. KV]|uniref:SH3 domain-containing protein n=1 Tax=Mariprofundus sp. KV TaxID=2608715 RepID=UPI0015A1555D|nr:SH3 domain-containing protein [Mariprofundus sp. KV]
MLLLLLCSCGLAKKPLQPLLETRIVNIEIAKIEKTKMLMIQQVNPVILAMGSSGILIDTALLIHRANRYTQHAGSINRICNTLFEESLLNALAQKGISTSSSNRAYWDYYRGKQKQLTKQMDAILKVELRNVGFWSRSPLEPYKPSIFVLAELIEPTTRKVLYSDRFTIGIDVTSLQVMKYLFGDINMVPYAGNAESYKTFSKLIDNPEQSRDALFQTVQAAARHLAKGLNGETKFIAETYARSNAQIQMAVNGEMTVDLNSAEIRTAPDSDSEVIQQLQKGDVVTRMQKQGDWYFVRLQDGSSAWAHHSIFVPGSEEPVHQPQAQPDNNKLAQANQMIPPLKPSFQSEQNYTTDDSLWNGFSTHHILADPGFESVRP